MLYSLILSFIDQFSFLNVFRYLTFRTGLSMMTSMIIVFIIGAPLINYFSNKNITGPIREDGPDDHLIKKIGTPTMGGIIILIGILLGTLLWSDLNNHYIWFLILVLTSFGILGAIDDFLKIKKKSSAGLSSRLKFIIQIILALIAIIYLNQNIDNTIIKNLYFPFFKNLILNLGIFFVPFSIFIIIGSSNAVNLTDGLDGLATVPVILVATSFALISYVVGNMVFSNYLQIPYIEGVGEVAIFCGAIMGSCLGFLWYNAPPAAIFMGDTGSLALGGALGAIAVSIKHEIVLAIIGGIFVVEAMSVIIQVLVYKVTKKRVFLMAPIHHHFEKLGWAEPQIVIRFWIIAVILALIGLATLKLR